MKIAVMPGDGVGKEVVSEGLKVLSAVAKKFGFTYDTTPYPFGAGCYQVRAADEPHQPRARADPVARVTQSRGRIHGPEPTADAGANLLHPRSV